VSKNRANRKNQSRGGRTYAALAILTIVMLAVVGYLLFSYRKHTSIQLPPQPTADVKTSASAKPRHPVTRIARPGPTVLPPRQPPPPVALPPQPVTPPGPAKPAKKPDYPVEPIVPVEKAPPQVLKGAGKGRLAIIIDDMGASMQEARSLSAIGVPLTFSIIPGLGNCREVAAYATGNGIETMIHIPMQSKGWPQRRLESNGLLVSMEDADIREHLEGFTRDIPRAVGANNHMGSEFTEHEEKMASVLGVLKGKGLFFIDSVTSPKSVGQRMAREMGMKSGRRNVFLDNEQNNAYIMGQLNQAVRQARKNGGAIAICHPHPATIKTLSAVLPTLSRQGITLVPASRLVR
jgi:uncharacterized protein